jgi:hypothetical protein
MEVNGQFHGQATLLLGKKTTVPTGQEARWASEPGRCEEEKNICSYSGQNPKSSSL